MNRIELEETQRYLQALLQKEEITGEILHKGEQHYTPPIKDALIETGIKTDPGDLGDKTAEAIKISVRFSEDICAPPPEKESRSKEILEKICPKLTKTSDDLSDALNIATVLAPFVASLAASIPLACALVAFSLVRIGVRQACARRSGD